MRKPYGQIAYEGYFESCGGKSLISGAPLPLWDAQSSEIKIAWGRAALEVINAWETEATEDLGDVPDFNGDMK